jgi:hypothetical protein
MFEKRNEPLLKTHKFIKRLAIGIIVGIFLVIIALLIGMLGYHHYEKMSWVDAFANASMILSGMGPFGPLTTTGGKIFAGFYAIFSGLSFILIIGIIFAPIIHRFFHKFHLGDDVH